MTKTLGAGSMGKVKLAVSSVTGEKVSIGWTAVRTEFVS